MTMVLAPGDRAPQFTLLDQHGEKVALKTHKGSPVLLYFYPKANTPGCTSQSCLLRDLQADISDAVVIGISPDQPEKLAAFDQQHSLGFPLLSDPEHKVAEKYGVWGPKKLYGKEYLGIIRSAFFITPTGRIGDAFYKVSPKKTPAVLLEAYNDSMQTP